MRCDTILFDLDGTLIDSEPVYRDSHIGFLAGYGIDYDDALCARSVGMSGRDFYEMLGRDYPESPLARLEVEERMALSDAAYLSHAETRTKVFPVMKEILSGMHGKGYKLAIASGSGLDVIRKTAVYAGIAHYFPVVVSSGEVARGKPHPDVFLEAARRLGSDARDCVVVEDSVYGVMAAKAAGMRCVAIPTAVTPATRDTFASADLCFMDGMETVRASDVIAFLSDISR